MIVETYCNKCKKKIGEREVPNNSNLNDLFHKKDYCKKCGGNKMEIELMNEEKETTMLGKKVIIRTKQTLEVIGNA
jgi:NAD-dependent SIR2 family protein deacetylase